MMVANLTGLFELRCQQKRLQFTVKGFSAPVLVVGDQTKLRQILVNILGNAVKFTGSGEVSFSITALDKNQYHFDIIDTGAGIPNKSQDKIFDAFQQDSEGGKKGGTGLGLAIAKKQLQLMGGRITVESKVGEGSCFTVELQSVPESS